MSKPKYFGRIKGTMTLHCEDVYATGVRFILGRFGEDPTKLINAFWKEYDGTGGFEVIPLFSYGNAPRSELCTQQSLSSALQSVTLEPDSLVEKGWKEAAEELNVVWPKRLSRLAPSRPETEAVA